MEKPDVKRDFAAVDQTDDPGFFVRFLDTAGAMEWFQIMKRRTYALLDVQEGDQILDVGCGTGDDVRALAAMVGRRGLAVGVDNSETMIMEARKRAEGSDLPVEYRLGDALQLPFAANTFDGCRAERILQHLQDPRKALGEMVRVTRPGGRVVVFDGDWETFIIDAGDRPVTRKIMNAFCDSIRNGWIGRQLPGLFKQYGLVDIAVVPDTLMLADYALIDQLLGLRTTVERVQTAGEISASEAAAWLADLEQRSQAGRFFAAITAFAISGRKPS